MSKHFYDVLPVFGVEPAEATSYALPTVHKVSRRIYGNLEIIIPAENVVNTKPKSYYSYERIGLNYDDYVHIVELRHEFSRYNQRESLWKRAVENLYKRVNFLQLTIELLQEDITEEEFEQILTEHEVDYVISLQEVKNGLEAEAIHDVVRALGRTFDVHEVAELFGVKPEALHEMRAQNNSPKVTARLQTAYLSSGY